MNTTKKKMKKLTRAQQVVQIAQDVMAQLKSRRYVAQTGRVYGGAMQDEIYQILSQNSNDGAQEYLARRSTCEVCAKGACLIAFIERHNNVSLGQLFSAAGIGTVHGTPWFKEVFPRPLLDEIETLFERRDYRWGLGTTISDCQSDKLISFSKAHLSDNDGERLMQIMRRLIRNGGKYAVLPAVARIK